jgi:hypothetical protein
MAAKRFPAAVAWLTGQVRHSTAPRYGQASWRNRCQMVSRLAVGASGWAPSARTAWLAIPLRHKSSHWPPPPGSIAYWGHLHVGNGHATYVGDGKFFSNDVKRSGQIDTVPIPTRVQDAFFVRRWGLPYLGYIVATPSGPLDIRKPRISQKAKPLPGRHAA